MDHDNAAHQADAVEQPGRARRPRWRAGGSKPAPGWFRGAELDLVDPAERRLLYQAATRRMGPVPWPQYLSMAALVALLIARGHTTWHGSHAAALAVWIAGVVVSTALRRRNIREHARIALRESADWPQRLARSQG